MPEGYRHWTRRGQDTPDEAVAGTPGLRPMDCVELVVKLSKALTTRTQLFKPRIGIASTDPLALPVEIVET